MPFTPTGYEKRAAECVRLARLAADEMVRRELLEIRQTYLELAVTLRREAVLSAGSDRDAPRRAEVLQLPNQ
jgi:hypothetical protein